MFYASLFSMNHFYGTLEKGIGAIKNLTGIPILWKSLDTEASHIINQVHCTHQTPYCLEIKAHVDKLPNCRFDDNISLILDSLTRKEPFLRKCHGGVIDYIIPVMNEVCYAGCFFCGPWRQPERNCPYNDHTDAYLQIPLFDQEVCHEIEWLLLPYGEFIIANTTVPQFKKGLSPGNAARMHLALSAIKQNLHGSVKAEIIAGACSLSVSRFLHLFSEAMQISFSNFIVRERINLAKRLIENTNQPMGLIAEQSGYTSQSYFNQVFRSRTGYSPGEYRKLARIDTLP